MCELPILIADLITNRIQFQELSTSLPSCASFGITVKPFDLANDTHGVPPFYMMAFAVGGTPTTTLLGTNETDLHWTVDHPVGEYLSTCTRPQSG